MPKSLTEQIIEQLGDPKEHICRFNDGDCKCECYYQARTEMINKIPEILSLIRGEVERYIRYTLEEVIEMNKDLDSTTREQAYLKSQGMIQMRDDLLEKLK